MGRYLLSRLLLMVPTFLGILVINFIVLRFQGASLVEEMSMGGGKGGEGVAAERKAGGASRLYENYIDRFRRAGNDLPAVLNLRGLTVDKAAVLERLRRSSPASGLGASASNAAEKELWLLGPWGVGPLQEVLADPSQEEYHGPASQALALCAHVTIDPREESRLLASGRLAAVQQRNQELPSLVIASERTREGFRTIDPEAGAKRDRLLALLREPVTAAELAPPSVWRSCLSETGFARFLGGLFTGSLYSETRKQYVFPLIAERWSTTFWLNTLAIAIAWCVSIPLGIRSARRLNTFEDRSTTALLFLLWSLPSFFVGTLLLHHLCTAGTGSSAWFPNAGISSPEAFWYSTPRYLADLAWHALLPLLVLSYGSFTSLSRYMRGNLLDQLGADYARSARAKGCDEDRVVYRHCLRNSLITMVTLAAGLLAELFGGVLIVEQIFSISGLGRLLLDAAIQRDAPLLMACTVIQVGLLLVGILVADLLYAVVDPRIRSRYG